MILVGKIYEPYLLNYFIGYFKHADNVVQKWCYTFAINYFVYKEWKEDKKEWKRIYRISSKYRPGS
jgi:hypothetical protein